MPVDMGNLLIVDDQVGVRLLVKEALSDAQYQVDQASDGQEALEMFAKKKYNLVILDVKMPGMSGIETLQEIRKMDRDVSVVLMTAYEELDLMEQARKLGVEHYLCKPFDLNELRSLARQLLQAGGKSRTDAIT